jgi:signal transduction histidine kinase
LDRFWVSSFGQDQQGNVWIGFNGDGGLVRYRHERFERFGSGDGIPPGGIRNLITDTRGRLWAASYRSGLIRIDRPSDERPEVFRYSTARGLSSNEVTAIVEDAAGRIYAATGRGLDRLDPATGRIRTYRKGESLPVGEINALIRDRGGVLWASYSAGVIRILPADDPPWSSPEALISGIRVAGAPQHISALGQSQLQYFELPWNRNSLEVDFVSPGPDDGLRYQIKLEGADADWSGPSEQRTVAYANLAPGRYRFLARAVNADGLMSSAAASVSFRILPPIWDRWWFRTAAALLISGLAYAFYRYRVSRLLEVVAIRTRIATDLHDDIGANLTRIAVLSEVVRRKGHADADDHLASIATVARESVTAMSDIVWAISPGRDGLNDLTSRMREHAEEVFAANGTELTFTAPTIDRHLRLSVDTRRDVYLVFKEAVNNAAHHSGCSRVHVSLQSDDRGLILSVADDGAGFDVASEDRGNGLASMRRRAERLGARFDIGSGPGKGTTVQLEVPQNRLH